MVVISLETTGERKRKVGMFYAPDFAANFIKSVLDNAISRREYIKLSVEIEEDTNDRIANK